MRVKNALTETITEYRSIENPFKYIYTLRNKRHTSVYTDEVNKELKKSMERELFVKVFDEIEDTENPIELYHVIRSFDPCMACTVHTVKP